MDSKNYTPAGNPPLPDDGHRPMMIYTVAVADRLVIHLDDPRAPKALRDLLLAESVEVVVLGNSNGAMRLGVSAAPHARIRRVTAKKSV